MGSGGLRPLSFDLSAPGSVIYDGLLAARGMQINRMGNSLKRPVNRDAFRADPEAYLRGFALSEEEREAVLARDWKLLIDHGGHLQALARIAAIDGHYLFHIAAPICGVDAEALIAACPRRVSGLDGLDG